MKTYNNLSSYIILMYHKVGAGYSDFIPALDIKTFAKQINFLRRFYEIISFQDLLNGNFKKNKEAKIIITFDDGYKCIYQYAYPVLKQQEIPATIFLTTDAIENNIPIWPDLISYYAYTTKETRINLVVEGQKLSFEFTNTKSKLHVIKQIKELLKRVTNNERLLLVEEIRKKLKVENPTNGLLDMLSWNEVREMSKNNITFGSHTMSHPILTRLSLESAKLEIEGARRIIDERLEKSTPIFAYPNGESDDFNEETAAILKNSSYKMACTTIFGSNDQNTNPHALKRVYTSGNSLLKFILRLRKALQSKQTL